jgi:hypothetical protein
MRFTFSRSNSDFSDGTHPGLLALVGVLTGVVLILTGGSQIYDTNFYSLWEATALLAGDHPYRDFYEWGIPLQAAVSALAQWLVGYRLIGEFLVQWLFIIAGAVISFHLAVRLSRSVLASLATALLAVALLAATPTFHYPKLFFYPLAVWLSCRYLERPSISRAAVLGVTTAIAFLFRHDHGVYIGGLAVLAFGLTRLAVPASRNLRSMLAESAAYTVTAAVLLAPWAIVVQQNEGLAEYVRLRGDLYEDWSASQSPYRQMLRTNPLRLLVQAELPAPKPGVVKFRWTDRVEEEQRQELERQYGLRVLQEPDSDNRWQYEVPNAYDVRLLTLNSFIDNTEGFDWERLQQASSRLPTRANAQTWLELTALLVPLLLLASAGMDGLVRWYRGEPIPPDTYCAVLAATFLALIDARLFREASYVVVVAPLTAALSSRLLVGKKPANVWDVTRWAIALGMLFLAGVTTYAYTRGTYIFRPLALADESLRPTFEHLLVYPPIDGNLPPEGIPAYDHALWNSHDGDKGSLMMRYVHDCTRAGDRVFVTGQTPYHVGYYIERPIAGGHVFWHHRWRSDPVNEMKSLALLEKQSVPFAMSTHDPILEDLKRYPSIREHFVKHYVELAGSNGLMLIDARRQPTGTFGVLGFPCFK